jgi:hypothetical protein
VNDEHFYAAGYFAYASYAMRALAISLTLHTPRNFPKIYLWTLPKNGGFGILTRV